MHAKKSVSAREYFFAALFKVIRVLCDKGREGVLQDTLINIQSFLFLFLLIGYVSSKYIVIKNSHSILLVHNYTGEFYFIKIIQTIPTFNFVYKVEVGKFSSTNYCDRYLVSLSIQTYSLASIPGRVYRIVAEYISSVYTFAD